MRSYSSSHANFQGAEFLLHVTIDSNTYHSLSNLVCLCFATQMPMIQAPRCAITNNADCDFSSIPGVDWCCTR